MFQKLTDHTLSTNVDERITSEQLSNRQFNRLGCLLSSLYLAYKFLDIRFDDSSKDGDTLDYLLCRDNDYQNYIREAFSASNRVVMDIMHDASNKKIVTVQISFFKNKARVDALIILDFNLKTGLVSNGFLGGNPVVH